MGKKKATQNAKTTRVTGKATNTTGKTVQFEVIRATKAPTSRPNGRTSGGGSKQTQPHGRQANATKPKQPKITKPVPEQGREGANTERIPQYLIERKKSKLFTFQRYKKIEGSDTKRAKHPKLIVDEEAEKYGYMGLTESEKQGNHKNIPLTKNPKKGDKRPAYLRQELRYDTKDSFVELENYHLAQEDKQTVLQWLAEKKKKG